MSSRLNMLNQPVAAVLTVDILLPAEHPSQTPKLIVEPGAASWGGKFPAWGDPVAFQGQDVYFLELGVGRPKSC